MPSYMPLTFCASRPRPTSFFEPRAARAGDQPQFDRSRMSFETFHAGQPCDHGAEFFNRARRGLDYTGAGEKIVRAQRRGEARRAARGQHVIGSGEIVAERGGADLAHKNRASRPHLPEPSRCIFEFEFEMLGCDAVGEREGFLQVIDHDQRSAPFEYAPDRGRPREIGERIRNRGGDAFGVVLSGKASVCMLVITAVRASRPGNSSWA